jgi:proteasome lid subunit RPN8/RPN11
LTLRELFLPEPLRAQIVDAARRAHPHECCGLIEGVAHEEGWLALALHETNNLADDASRRFLIDPEVQFRLLRSLRGSGRSVIGCFHSHPGGVPLPSEQDREEAAEDGFLWLVAGGSPEQGYELGAHLFEGTHRRFATLRII